VSGERAIDALLAESREGALGAPTRCKDVGVVMKAWRTLIVLAALPSSANAGDVAISGRAGYMSEWEITASAHATTPGRQTDFAGPLVMKHVGLCTTNGPVEKSGTIRFSRKGFISSAIEATLTFGDEQCTFVATGGNTLVGIMQCPGTQGVPLRLKMN